MMQYWIPAFAILLFTNTFVIADDVNLIECHRTSAGVPYGTIRDRSAAKIPAPTLFVFALGLDDMEKQLVYTDVARIVARSGWLSVIVEPPCHGEDTRETEPGQLDGWRHRLEHGDPLITEFTTKASAVLDELISQGLVDPQRVAVCGTSRGGFLAYHFAAAETRVKAAAGVSPVTRLTALREFFATSHRERAEQIDAANLATKLVGKSIWLSIGNNDARVSTDDAIAFTRAVVNASARPDQSNAVIPVELIVAPSTGHSKIDQAHELLAQWLVKQFPATP